MSDLGGKADNLIRLRDEFGLNVPEFIAVPLDEFIVDYHSKKAVLDHLLTEFLESNPDFDLMESQISQVLAGIQINQDKVLDLAEKVQKSGWSKVSFRSSAMLEDGLQDSFAGQYQSFLDVEPNSDEIAENLRNCFASMISVAVISYARNRGLSNFSLGGSVIIQQMFYGNQSGVLFTENGKSQIQLAISEGWQNQAVEGHSAQELVVDRFAIEESQISMQLKELCRLSLVIERQVGFPVDIEWAVDEKQVVFLQFRPITTANLDYSFEWDSTNISENYPGITLPLTYSVIRGFYGAVYLAFFRMLGAKPNEIKNAAPITENMLGYLEGRVYYRITNWYEAIKLMPGKRNQEYFEAMLNPVKKRGKAEQSKLDARSVITQIRLAILLTNSERISRSFSKKIQQKIALHESSNFNYLNAATVIESGKRLRHEILEDWAVTILNDVRLMIFHGILQRLYSKSSKPMDYLQLIQGLKDRASIRPLEQLSELGNLVEQVMQQEGLEAVDQLLQSPSWEKIRLAVTAYSAEFAARTPGELKLENQRLTDDSLIILELARKAAGSGISSKPDATKREILWPDNLSKIWRPVVSFVAKQTRSAIDWRERFRFYRAQTFNLSRMAFDTVGQALASEQIIAEPRDIYWLTDAEVEDLVGAHAPVLDAKEIVRIRKAKFAEYETSYKTLAVRGTGRIAGMHQQNLSAETISSGLVGNPVAPGQVKAEAVVLTEFDPNIDVRGKILVVHYTDPGWTLLFTQAAGVIAERGNALSHAAIISREIGIPAIVGLSDATTKIQTGQLITISGSTGEVKIESD